MQNNILDAVSKAEEVLWTNPKKEKFESYQGKLPFSASDVQEAEERLRRFAPVIMYYFPETKETGGIIESPLKEIPNMKAMIEARTGRKLNGRVFLKMDSHLKVSGSVKARGGIYEVLKHTEDIALNAGILHDTDDDYLKLTSKTARDLFAKNKIQVGSTGNLGLSIGIMSAALGYEAIVHMSADAKQWKKDLLRGRGVKVIEYAGDYAQAVENGRKESEADPASYFVDDEHSRELFCGYAVAGKRLDEQLHEIGIAVDEEHPLYVYIPCGVGGAPGGITFGLSLLYQDHVHVFLVEPVQSPCMLLGLASRKYSAVSVQDYGLTGKTEADGLAVGRCSELVAQTIEPIIEGAVTVDDKELCPIIQALWESEHIFIEPSAGAAFQPLFMDGMPKVSENANHIVWATGGSMMPEEWRKKYYCPLEVSCNFEKLI